MGLELGTFVDDLIQTNPLGSDDKRQGDDHLRLIKKVLQNTIKRASKAFYLPNSIAKAANYTVLDTDENMTIQCDTTTAFTLTLPSLDISRAGWAIHVVKASADMNPVFLVPSAGTINAFTKIRRSVAASITQVVWTGTTWVASRPHGAPIGSVLEYYGSNLPQGHLWANGGLIDNLNFPEVASVLGLFSPDRRGRAAFGRDDMGGTAAGRITNVESGIVGTTLGTSGGAQSIILGSAQIPAHSHPNTIGQGSISGTAAAETTKHQHKGGTLTTQATTSGTLAVGPPNASPTSVGVQGGSSFSMWPTTSFGIIDVGPPWVNLTDDNNATHTHSVSGSTSGVSITNANNTGGGGSHPNVPPALICNAIVVAE